MKNALQYFPFCFLKMSVHTYQINFMTNYDHWFLQELGSPSSHGIVARVLPSAEESIPFYCFLGVSYFSSPSQLN